MLVLVKEDGSGMATANSYASVVDGDAYHDGHLYAAPWSPPPNPDTRETALVMATRLIDAYCRFLGFKKTVGQALQWPRQGVIDRESDFGVAGVGLMRQAWPVGPVYLSADVVPACVVNATCEMARMVMNMDRTAEQAGIGMKSMSVSGSTFVYDKNDRMPVLTPTAVAMLARVLVASPNGSVAQLRRV